MLTARGTKRNKSTFFDMTMMFDILDGERQLGTVVFDRKTYSAALVLDGKNFTVRRISERHDERFYEALIRVLTGGQKPPANPWALRDAAGDTLALGDIEGATLVVNRGEESFSLRRVKRAYHLYRAGSNQSLGWVGQQKIFTSAFSMDFPGEFDPAFQVFLLTLMLSLSMKTADNGAGT
jgi:hypothetical protein